MKRVNLAVSDEMYETLSTIAQLRGVSMSGMVVGLLADFVPGWRREIKKLEPLREQERELEAHIETLRRRAARVGKRQSRKKRQTK